jgi:hypothetical protein
LIARGVPLADAAIAVWCGEQHALQPRFARLVEVTPGRCAGEIR